MVTKKIYLIRHGETDFNLKGIVQGSGVDTSLNDTGRKQAAAFYQTYKHIPFARIYTSKLKRTIESVGDFIDNGIPYEMHEGLNEISWGDKDGKIVSSEDHSYYTEVINCWKRGEIEKCIQGGESPADVQRRQKPVIDLIVSRPEEETILICMHGRAIRILLASLLHQDLRKMDQFAHNNLCLYMLNYSASQFTMEKYNDIDHLKTLKEII